MRTKLLVGFVFCVLASRGLAAISDYDGFRVYSLDWAFMSSSEPRVAEIKSAASYRIVSDDGVFADRFVAWLRLDRLKTCNIPDVRRDNTVVVIELMKSSGVETYTSDGKYLYTESKSKCMRVSKDFVAALSFGSLKYRM